MELSDAALKIDAPGKWQHFQKDFFYRLVCRPAADFRRLNQNKKGFPIEGANQIQDSYNLLPVRPKVTEI
jgi:hypothetical protein